MKPFAFSRRFLSLLIAFLLTSPFVVAQRKNVTSNKDAELSLHQQDALDLMTTLARELKTEPDKLTAAALQARLADVVWNYDASFAKEVFSWAFDAARTPPSDDISKAERTTYAVRQASSIKEVLTRLGTHDQKRAEEWFKILQEEKAVETRSSEMGQLRSELLIQIALQLTATDSDQALRLGLLSLSGGRIPEDFGSLLFALSNVSRSLSNQLFRAALANMRRNEYVYDSALISLVNYIFGPNDTLHPDTAVADAQLLANYFVDAAWRQARGVGVSSVPESNASFYSLVEVRGLPIVSRYAPERVPELQGQMRELASKLSQAQMENTARMRAAQQQQIAVANRNSYDIDEQLERATKEKDAEVRDALLNSIAHALMRSDTERALKVAGMIQDTEIREQAEDEINLVEIQKLLVLRSYNEARKTTFQLKNTFLQAKVLAQLANKVVAENKDTGLAAELLSEAAEILSKHEPVTDKLMALLLIAQNFGKFDAVRGFEILGRAVKALNQLKLEDTPRSTVLSKPRPLRIKSYIVIDGSEMSTSDRATFDSIDFSQVGPFVAHDYMQTRLLANKIENPLWRAKFLTAVASAVLLTPPRRIPRQRSNVQEPRDF